MTILAILRSLSLALLMFYLIVMGNFLHSKLPGQN